MAGPPEIITQPPTRTRSGWRGAAVALVAIVAGMVMLSRLDDAQPLPASTPASTAAAVARDTPASLPSRMPAASPDALPRATPRRTSLAPAGGAIGRTADGSVYMDGIPARVAGSSVYRVRDALNVPVGRTLLVGGWYHRLKCEQARRRGRCGSTSLSDVAIGYWHPGWLATDWIEMDRRLRRSGAWVVRGTVEDDSDCSIPRAGSCQPRLRVLETIWSADFDELRECDLSPTPRASVPPSRNPSRQPGRPCSPADD